MPDDVTLSELGRSLDKFATALDKFSARLDAISDRLDNLPLVIDSRYVRKDVNEQRIIRVDRDQAEQDSRIDAVKASMERQFEKLSNNVRWLVGIVLIPVALAVFALLQGR